MKSSAVIVGKGVHWSGTERVIRWDEYTSIGDEVSLPAGVEEEAELLRQEYLAWVHELSSTPIEGKNLPERLTICKGISAWWSGTFVEKSLYKTPQIYDVLRLRALERYVEKVGIKHLTLGIPDRALNEALKSWCQQNGITYGWYCKDLQQKSSLKNRCRHWLPAPVQAALFLIRYLWRNREFLACKTPVEDSGPMAHGLTVFSYFDNLDKKIIGSGRFGSLFWDGLPALQGKMGWSVNWIFHFTSSALCPNPEAALGLQQSFTLHDGPTNRFFFLEQWLSWRVVMQAILVYWKIRWRQPAERSVRRIFQFRDSRFNFWPVMKGAWRADMSGSGAMENALVLSLFSELASKSPRQTMGICLAEYQGWERTLLQCWRKNGHKTILGFAHSTVRFFDLRYYEDAAAYGSQLPRYDSLLAGGQFALDALRKVGYPSRELVGVEALRYLYLTSDNLTRRDSKVDTARRRILVLTDYDKNVSMEQIRMLGKSIEEDTINRPFFITIKPHPNLDIGKIVSAYLPAGSYEITNAPLSELLSDAHVAYASNFTSASLDTAYSKVPTIIALSGAQINMSPLRGVPGVTFVTNPSELAGAINNPKPLNLPHNYFYLSNDLRLWRELLER